VLGQEQVLVECFIKDFFRERFGELLTFFQSETVEPINKESLAGFIDGFSINNWLGMGDIRKVVVKPDSALFSCLQGLDFL